MKIHLNRTCGILFLTVVASVSIPLRATTLSTNHWDVTILDRILGNVQSGQKLAQIGDMQILVSNLRTWRNQLAGVPTLESAFDGTAPLWTGGNVYYTFSSDGATAVSDIYQRAFLDGAKEWETFANVHFIPRTTQANYFTVRFINSLSGGQSAVGMVGGQQFLDIGPNAWNRNTICHELGHTLGLIHEQSRSDRDSYVNILTGNIIPGTEGNFVKLSNSLNQGPYDFLSVMHYARNAFSIDPALDTIEPLPAYQQYLNIFGQRLDTVLSVADRAGMAAIYGAGPTLNSVVVNTQDSGPGSLRAALYYAFDHPGTTVTFNIPTNDPGFSSPYFAIHPTDQLPNLVHGTILDGSSEPVHSNPFGPSILLSGSSAQSAGTFPNGLKLTGSNCVVRSLVINNWDSSGILIDGIKARSNTVRGCYLGTDSSGSFATRNGLYPISIASGASDNLIGGITAEDRNIISGSFYQGLVIRDPGSDRNIVEGNFIGVNAAGTAAIPNAWSGIAIYYGARSNQIGGLSPGARNVISGNSNQGIVIANTNSDGNIIEGNYVGLNAAGTVAIPNGWSGINLFSGPRFNIIGGASSGAGNIVSGNGNQGVLLQDPGTANNVVAGNFIGLNAAGTAAVPNTYSGVGLFGGATSNTIGGTVVTARNIISGNDNQGIAIGDTNTSGNKIQGNYIGVNPSGTAPLPNLWAGVDIFTGPQGNVIGGTVPGAGNVISGNQGQGVVISQPGTIGNMVQGNLIGLNAAGTAAISNTWSGVELYGAAQSNLIGGNIGARNFISGNGNNGVAISGTNTSFNLVQGNTIGLNRAGTIPIPNAYSGVSLFNAASGNQVGGLALGTPNLIAGNTYDGVQIFDGSSSDNAVRANSVFGNGGNGIILYDDSNLAQAAPSLSSAVLTTNTTITGNLTSNPNTTFHLDFYASPAPINQAQATTYIGSRDVTTGAGGSVGFSLALASPVPKGCIITATATDPAGNTSSLSSKVTVTATDTIGDGIPDAWRTAHFGGAGTTTNNLSCATCDPDKDGSDNRQELLAGTDPNNAASKLQVNSIDIHGLDVDVQFQSVNGITYRIEERTSLESGVWSIVADQVSGTGAMLQLTDPGAASLPQGFYRVDVLP